MKPTTAVETHPDSEGQPVFVLVASLCGALSLVGVVITLRSPIVDHPAFYASLRGVMTFGLLAVGLYGWRHEPGGRYPVMLLILCCLFALTSLTGVNDRWLFALGRMVVACGVLFSVYVFLSYPYGALHDSAARSLVRVAAIGTALSLLLTLLFSTEPPVAGPFVRCAGNCPENPLAIVDSTGVLGRVGSAALSVWTVAFSATTALLLARRMHAATALERRALGPVLAWTMLVSAGYAVYLAARALDSGADALAAIGTLIAAIIALIPVALGAGLVRGRVFAATALRRVLSGLGERPSPAGIRRALAGAFRDPSLELLFWSPAIDAYVDGSGRKVELPTAGVRAFTRFDRHGEPVAAALHDRGLADYGATLEAAGGVVLLALENARLEADLRAHVSELQVSRARLVAVADEERRRIERDLHDGAQQQLIAVGVKLALLKEVVDEDSALASKIADAEDGITAALDLIRELAQGIYPQALRHEGLAQALTFVAVRLPTPVNVHADGLRRFAPQIETAVYFCCLEALQNVAKHALAHAPVELRLTDDDDELRFSVADDGRGFDPRIAPERHGITGMRDRLGAVGGQLEIVSAPGKGATITGRVPLDCTRSPAREGGRRFIPTG